MGLPQAVVINGSVRRQSRTGGLLAAVTAAITARVRIETRSLTLATDGPALLAALTREQLSPMAADAITMIESADLLLIGTPVYRGSYTGVLKHVFDLVHRPALAGKIAVLAACGGSAQHRLVIEHQLRPLLGFFNAYTVPTGIYATEADFEGVRLASDAVSQRIARAADEAAWLLAKRG